MVVSSKRRRPPKVMNKNKHHQYQLPWVTIILASSLVLCLISNFQFVPLSTTGISMEEEPHEYDHDHDRESIKKEQCQESCRATLSKRGYSFSTGATSDTSSSSSSPSAISMNSDSLSFSAVSAMFSIRDGDDQGNYLHDEKGNLGANSGTNDSYHAGHGYENESSHVVNTGNSNSNGNGNIAPTTTSNAADLLLQGGLGVSFGVGENYVLRNISRRPQRLPPLIEELVGTIDSDFVSVSMSGDSITSRQQHQYHHQQQHNGGQRGRLIRREKTDETDNENDQLGEITKRGLRDFTPGEDSVAMVAAAAAAAVWSEAETKRGRLSLRMNKVNNEWEEALRWISSWGQNLASSNTNTNTSASTTTYTTDTVTGDTKNDIQNGGAGEKQRQRRDSSDNRQRLPSKRFNAENEIDFERFLDVCIDRCIGDDRGDRTKTNARHKAGLDIDVDKVTNYLDFRKTVGLNQILSSIQSIVQKIRSATRGMIQSRTYEQTLRSIFGFMLSTTILWLIRNINDWRKINKYTTSLRSLLEEEKREATMNMTEGSSTKPKVKYRNASVNANAHAATKKSGSKKSRRRRRDHRNHKKQCHLETRVSIDEDNESEASEDSFERRYIEEECHRKHSEDQTSKEGNTTCTVSSCTTDGVIDRSDFEYQLMSTDDTIMKLHLTNKNTRKSNNAHLAKKQRDVKAVTSQKTKDKHLSSKCQASPTTIVQYPTKPYNKAPNQHLPLVPTTEQRKEAARRLREFQQAQIQKIINSKQRQMTHVTNVNAQYAAKQITLRDLAQVNAPHADRDHNNDRLKLIPPPPGLTRVAVVGEEEQIQETDAGYILSHLLEGDDDDIDDGEQSSYNNASKETSPERFLPNRQDSSRSIALGDLLAGSYSGTGSHNFNSFPSNPWKDESVGGCTAETYIGSPTHSANRNATSLLNAGSDMQCSTDANICLQVSAVAFSPSMKIDPTGEEKIW